MIGVLFYNCIKKTKKIPWIIRGTLIRIRINSSGGHCGSGLLVEKGCFFKYPFHKGISIGSNVHFGRNIHVDVPLGGILSIGNNTSFTGDCYISSKIKVEIGDNVLIAEFVSIRDSFHQFVRGILIKDQPMVSENLTIRNDVWIGRGVAILKGSFLESGTIIGANSMVNFKTSAMGIYVGTPARLLKFRNSQNL